MDVTFDFVALIFHFLLFLSLYFSALLFIISLLLLHKVTSSSIFSFSLFNTTFFIPFFLSVSSFIATLNLWISHWLRCIIPDVGSGPRLRLLFYISHPQFRPFGLSQSAHVQGGTGANIVDYGRVSSGFKKEIVYF